MRISTSPVEIRNKFISKAHQTPILIENSRSNSLSNSGLHSSKFITRVETPYCSPYYNQNSSIFIPSQQEIVYETKMFGKPSGNVQNPHILQNAIKNLSERVQILEKQQKTQENFIRTNLKINDQKQLIDFINDKIAYNIEKKALPQYDLLFHEIKKLQNQISQKLQLQTNRDYESLGTSSFVQLSKQKPNEQHENMTREKRSMQVMEEKIKQEIFKLQIHLENQMNKSLKVVKNSAETANENSSAFLVAARSKLKYKFRPVQIIVKNQISVNMQESGKKKKENLSTEHSTGSSDEYEGKSEAKILEQEKLTYFIDKEGYLLDENGFYLLDEKDKMIKVDRKLLKKLKEFKVIE